MVLGIKEAVCQLSIRICETDNSHSNELAAILGNTRALTNDLGRVDKVLEELLVNGGEGTGSGTLLLVGSTGVSLRLGEDSALGNEDDVFV